MADAVAAASEVAATRSTAETLIALRSFAAQTPSTPVPAELRHVVEDMSRTGVPNFEWPLLRPLLTASLADCLDTFHKAHPGLQAESNADRSDAESKNVDPEFEEGKVRLLETLKGFSGAPFTLQRLCELILKPGLYYTHVNKLMFGLAKLLSVTSVLEVELPEASTDTPINSSAPVDPRDEENKSMEIGSPNEEGTD